LIDAHAQFKATLSEADKVNYNIMFSFKTK